MSKKICGRFPPYDDFNQYFSKEMSKVTSCLRVDGHEGEHIFKKPDGSYISFEDYWGGDHEEFSGEDVNHWDIFVWNIDEEVAKAVLAKEEPLN